MPSIDPSILRALALDASSAKIASHGGSGFASTFRITTPSNSIFVKTSPGTAAATMFEGEHASLDAMNSAVPSLCPRSLAWGKFDDKEAYFLATEFLELGGRSSSSKGGSGMSLAQKLAKLHSIPAPVPEGFSEPQFGFPVTTCCGDTPQNNSWNNSWADFFAKNRLLAILERGEQSSGNDPELRKVVERAVKEVVPRLLGEGHLGGTAGIKPVIVHGDLWSGNHGRGRFVGRPSDSSSSPDAEGGTEEVIFDPSTCYAHSEYELGIMQMFGGFGASFMKEYHSLVPKTEPMEEYVDRVKLYESYHHLNHWAIFGGGYRSGAIGILKGLVRKYGERG